MFKEEDEELPKLGKRPLPHYFYRDDEEDSALDR
jgi:hypothetical protein